METKSRTREISCPAPINYAWLLINWLITGVLSEFCRIVDRIQIFRRNRTQIEFFLKVLGSTLIISSQTSLKSSITFQQIPAATFATKFTGIFIENIIQIHLRLTDRTGTGTCTEYINIFGSISLVKAYRCLISNQLNFRHTLDHEFLIFFV